MKKYFFSLLLFCATVMLCAKAPVQYENGDFRRISAMTARVLDRNHYSQTPMTEEFSGRIFDNFIDYLDPERIFFSEEDLKKYLPERPLLGYKLQQGECRLAFDLYQDFARRFAEYREFSQKFLAGKIDFTVNETYSLDRRRQMRAKNEAELKTLWKQYLKHQLLIYKLTAIDLKNNKDSKKTVEQPSPEKRILQRQRDLGNAITKKEKIDILGTMLNAMANTYGAHSSYNPPKAS